MAPIRVGGHLRLSQVSTTLLENILLLSGLRDSVLETKTLSPEASITHLPHSRAITSSHAPVPFDDINVISRSLNKIFAAIFERHSSPSYFLLLCVPMSVVLLHAPCVLDTLFT